MHQRKLLCTAMICFAAGLIAGILLESIGPHFVSPAAGEDSKADKTAKQAARPSAQAPSRALLASAPEPPQPGDRKLRIICFGAHPDDCELQAGGTAALWATAGHQV